MSPDDQKSPSAETDIIRALKLAGELFQGLTRNLGDLEIRVRDLEARLSRASVALDGSGTTP